MLLASRFVCRSFFRFRGTVFPENRNETEDFFENLHKKRKKGDHPADDPLFDDAFFVSNQALISSFTETAILNRRVSIRKPSA